MDPDTTNYLLAIFFFIHFMLLSIIKVVFKHAEKYESSLKNQGHRWLAQKVKGILEDRPFFTAVVSVGKTVSGSLLTLAMYYIFKEYFQGFALYAIVVTTFTLIVSFPGYVVPKALAASDSERWLPLAYYFYILNQVIFYLVAFLMSSLHKGILKMRGFDEKFSFLTAEEKEKLSNSGDREETLDNDEREMIRNIFEFGETTVREVMVPRIDMTGLRKDIEYTQVLKTIMEEGHSRIPIYEETIDSIVGILYAKDIIGWLSSSNGVINPDEWSMDTIMKKPYFVPANKKLDDLMTEMKENHTHLVIVVDEYGGTAGIVTMEDILEEIVGEIRDEYDEEEEEIRKIESNTWLVDPHMELDDVSDVVRLNFDFDEKEYSTIGGLFYHEFGDVPEEGTSFEFHGYLMTITKMDHQRIEEIQLVVPEDIEDKTEIDDAF